MYACYVCAMVCVCFVYHFQIQAVEDISTIHKGGKAAPSTVGLDEARKRYTMPGEMDTGIIGQTDGQVNLPAGLPVTGTLVLQAQEVKERGSEVSVPVLCHSYRLL